MSKRHYSDYDEATTTRCERALVTLLGDIGPWDERVYLAGGLAPRYIVGSLPEGARPHVGTTPTTLCTACSTSATVLRMPASTRRRATSAKTRKSRKLSSSWRNGSARRPAMAPMPTARSLMTAMQTKLHVFVKKPSLSYGSSSQLFTVAPERIVLTGLVLGRGGVTDAPPEVLVGTGVDDASDAVAGRLVSLPQLPGPQLLGSSPLGWRARRTSPRRVAARRKGMAFCPASGTETPDTFASAMQAPAPRGPRVSAAQPF